MEIKYCGWLGKYREGMIHSKIQFDELLSRAFQDADEVYDLIREGKDILTIYFPQEFKEYSKWIVYKFDMITGYIIKVNSTDKFLYDEQFRGRYADTFIDVISIRNGKEDKHIKLQIVSVANEGIVYDGHPELTLRCFFSGIISFFMKLSKPMTVQDYEEWKNDDAYKGYYFYHQEEGMTEEQIEFLIVFADESMRTQLIYDIATRLNEKYVSKTPLRIIHNKFKPIIEGELKGEYADYEIIVSSFNKEILKEELDKFREDNNEQAVTFVEECLKRIKE